MSLLRSAHGAATPLRSSMSHSPSVLPTATACPRPTASGFGVTHAAFLVCDRQAKPLQTPMCATREQQYDLTPPGAGGQLPPGPGTKRRSGMEEPSEEPGESWVDFLYGCADLISKAGPGIGFISIGIGFISIGIHGLPALGYGIGCGIGTGFKDGLNGLGAGVGQGRQGAGTRVGKGLQEIGTGLKEGVQGFGGGVKEDLARVGAAGQEGLPEITAGEEAGKEAAGGAAPFEGGGPRPPRVERAPTPLRAAASSLAEEMQGFGSRGEGPSMAQAVMCVAIAPATILSVAAVAVAVINSRGGKGTSP